MKKWGCRYILILLMLSYQVICCFASADGTVILQADCYKGFDKSVVVNLVDEAGANYLIVAEPENQWSYDMVLPAGGYDVEYASVDDVTAKYSMKYPKNITVVQGESTELKVTVFEPEKAVPDQEKSEAVMQRRSLKQILQDSTATLLLMAVVAATSGIIKYRKEKKDYGG